jgi:stage V sporulation protein B
MIYKSPDVAYYIRLLAPLIPFTYLDMIADTVLKGVGEQASVMRYNILFSSLSVILIYLLLPRYAIMGYIMAVYAVKILNLSLSLNKLIHVTRLSVDIWSIVKSVGCMIVSIGISQTFSIHFSLAGTAALYFQVPFIVILYLLFLRLCSCITHDDVLWIRSLFQ